MSSLLEFSAVSFPARFHPNVESFFPIVFSVIDRFYLPDFIYISEMLMLAICLLVGATMLLSLLLRKLRRWIQSRANRDWSIWFRNQFGPDQQFNKIINFVLVVELATLIICIGFLCLFATSGIVIELSKSDYKVAELIAPISKECMVYLVYLVKPTPIGRWALLLYIVQAKAIRISCCFAVVFVYASVMSGNSEIFRIVWVFS
jgi:hypothetical protein